MSDERSGEQRSIARGWGNWQLTLNCYLTLISRSQQLNCAMFSIADDLCPSNSKANFENQHTFRLLPYLKLIVSPQVISLRRLVLPSTESSLYDFALKMQKGPFLQIYSIRKFANPIVPFWRTCCPREKLIVLFLRLWNFNFHKKEWIKAFLAQIGRLCNNLVKPRRLQKNIGKIVIFSAFKGS